MTEPSINSLLAVENAMKAFTELRKSVNRHVSLFGVVVNRLRPSVAEHQYRINELDETYGSFVLGPAFEERSAVQQSQGAGRSIHSWPGQSAAKIAILFDALLDKAQESFASEAMRRLEITRKASSRNRHSKRTKEVGSKGMPLSLSGVEKVEISAPRVELVNVEPVSPEYQEQWNEVLRQTLTKKQLKALQPKKGKEPN